MNKALLSFALSTALATATSGCAQTRECPVAVQTPGSSVIRRTVRSDAPPAAPAADLQEPDQSVEIAASLLSEIDAADERESVAEIDVDERPIRLTSGLGTRVAQAAPDAPPPLPAAEDALPLESEKPAGADMTLDSLEQLALENNPAIRQASAAAYKAIGTRHQVGRCPNPTIGYSGQQLVDQGTDQHLAFVEQDIVLGHKLQLNQQVLDQDVQSQLWEVEVQRYRVLTDIRLRFYEALAAQRRMELATEFHRVTEQGVRIAEKRKEALEGSQPEVLQAEIQLNEVDLLKQRAEIAYQAAWKELAATAGVPEMQPAKLDGTLDPASTARDWDLTYQNIVGSSPELRAAYARVRRAQVNLERQQTQPIPNLQTQLMAGYDQATDSQMINVQVGVPVPVFNRNRGNIDAAYAEYSRATHDARRIELSLKARLARVSQEFDSAAVAVERYSEQILPKAQQTLDLSEQAYVAGEFDFLQVLIARRTYFESNLQYVQALGELAQANATVEGILLTGGLDAGMDFTGGDELRGQALSGQ